jgi:hypothetical protein
VAYPFTGTELPQILQAIAREGDAISNDFMKRFDCTSDLGLVQIQ